ncbi:MAG: ABC transporter permease [Verrucomicrobia bacterium]|nr:ABC transporter permease [Verrucomicrobiota bacterium]
MALPLRYSFRNVLIRWRSTFATVLGIALVVFVFVLLQSLAAGIEKSSGNTGDPRNIMIVRKGSTAESASLISRENLREIQYFEEIARNDRGEPIISADVLVLVNLPRSDGSGEANVLLRGVSPRGVELRPQVRLVAGRWFTPGKREIVVSSRMANRFANFGIGQSFKAGTANFIVVGWLDGGGSAFDSECWMDADECRSVFERDLYSSFLVRPVDESAATKFLERIEADRRFKLKAEKEVEYYRKQTMTAAPIKWLGGFLAIMMSVGAVFAAMNTMYASIGARTREIGTLRVLGFRRRSVVLALLIEGALLALIGGIVGCGVAYLWNGYTTATMGFETFSEIVFEFTVTPRLMAEGLIFAVLVGLLGSFLPSVRASRLPVIAALKSV